MRGCLIIFFLLQFYGVSFATDTVVFGEVTPEEISLEECPFDKDAPAVYSKYSGEIKMHLGYIYIKKHVRIKILDKKGLDEATVNIPYFAKDGYERLSNIKAQTINSNSNQKLEFHEIRSDQFYQVDLTNNWEEVRFTFPNVKVGSILEYEYTIISENFLYLEDWAFQFDLPVMFSDLKVKIPSSLSYQVLLQGNRLLKKYREISTNYWVLENVPAARNEPFLYNKEDHLEKLKFQLVSYEQAREFGLPERKAIMKTWEDLAEEVLDSYAFRSYLNKSSTARDIIKSLNLTGKDQLNKCRIIYNYVLNNYQWTGKYRRYTYQKFSDFHEKKKGHSSELNLFLTLLLSEAGLEAYPVLLSTRTNGHYLKEHPFLSQFNHLATYVFIQGKEYLLDATDKFRPFHLMAENDQVKEGYVLNKRNPRWWDLPVANVSKYEMEMEIDISANQNAKGSFKLIADNFYALEARKEIFTLGINSWQRSALKYVANHKKRMVTVNNLRNIDQEFSIEGEVWFDFPTTNGDAHFRQFSPYLLNILNENPFISNVRNFPVQFPYKSLILYDININLPPSFSIHKIPTSEKILLPNDYGYFSLVVAVERNNIKVSIEISINTLELEAKQYENIRQFYALFVSKLNEEIIISKH